MAFSACLRYYLSSNKKTKICLWPIKISQNIASLLRVRLVLLIGFGISRYAHEAWKSVLFNIGRDSHQGGFGCPCQWRAIP